MTFCLTKLAEDKLKKAMMDRKLNPTQLMNMTSEARSKFFASILDMESAKQVNLLFEKKLLLVNREKALLSWAKDVTGISKEAKAKLSTKIKSTYAEKKRRTFNPKEEEEFLNELTSDVYSRRYKVDVSLDEAQTITELSQSLEKYKSKMNEDFTWKNETDGINYGASKVALDNYVGELKRVSDKESIISPLKQGTLGFTKQVARTSFNFIADNSRSLKASFDNSLWGRQGIKVLYTHPTVWAKNFASSFSDIAKTIIGGIPKGDAIMDATKAEIYSRQNYLNGRYDKGEKLDIGTGEEEFPTSLPARIPVLGRVFKASEVSYEAGAMRLRVDVVDKIYELAEKTGVDMNSKEEIGAINNMINSLTGRGKGLGGLTEGKAGKTINKAFFSIKFFKSNLDALARPVTSKTKFTRKEASKNLLKMIASIGIILGIAHKINPDSVELDPRSSDFGKIKYKNTRFDVTGGMGSIVVLISRILTQATKSSMTKITKPLNLGFGSADGMDIFFQFMENKFSPMFSTIATLIKQENFDGDKPTIKNLSKDLTVPIILTQAKETHSIEGAGMALLATIADGLGVSANTYTVGDNWNNSITLEMQQMKEKLGQEKFDEANEDFNTLYQEKFDELIGSDKYKSMSDEDKRKTVTKLKSDTKKDIFKKYKYKYKKVEKK